MLPAVTHSAYPAWVNASGVSVVAKWYEFTKSKPLYEQDEKPAVWWYPLALFASVAGLMVCTALLVAQLIALTR